MGAINAVLKGLRALKNVNTGGRGISGLATKESWINPMQVNLKTGEIGRKIKDGISLDKAKESLKLDKDATFVGSKQFKDGSGAHFIAKDAKGNLKYANTKGETLPSGNAKVFLKNNKNDKGFNYAPFRYDTDALTMKSKAIGLAGLGGLGYGVYKGLSSDSDNNKSANVIANAAKLNNSQNNETASNTENSSKNRFIKAVSGQLRTPKQEAKLQEIRERRAREADPERDLPYYAKSGQGQTDPIQPPKVKTNVKPKTKSGLNYDPIAEWARADQATNDKWNKRRETYNRMVGEGIDPYEAYDRSMQEQAAEPASATNTNTTKPVQNNNKLSYNPMFTDQAIELRRKQQGKS
jgi:hypothetical protein